jgi:hypothetical protein
MNGAQTRSQEFLRSALLSVHRNVVMLTATNPLVAQAFALLICAAQGAPAYPGVAGREPDGSTARRHADAISKAMHEVQKVLAGRGS